MRIRVALLTFIMIYAPGFSLAVEGALEINQTCASTGCFPGDTAGFPVTIDGNSGSRFVLTSDLEVAASFLNGIRVDAGDVTIDLNGFAIRGPNVCSGTPTTCSDNSFGEGVFSIFAGIEVRNGLIRGMGDNGVDLGDGARVDGLRVVSNGGIGIEVGSGSLVTDSVVRGNRSDGIMVGIGSTTSGCTTSDNGGHGVSTPNNTLGAAVVRTSSYSNDGRGFSLGTGSLVAASIARSNAEEGIFVGASSTVNGSTSVQNGGNGIFGSPGTNVSDSTSSSNGGNGIFVAGNGRINRNVTAFNGGFGITGALSVGYGDNSIGANTGGTVGAATNTGGNVCESSATCP